MSISDFSTRQAALDVCQRLVAAEHLLWLQVCHVGHQQQLAIHQLGLRLGRFVHRVGEQLALQVDLHDLGQVSLAHRVVQPRLGAAVRELAPLGLHAGVLPIELARPRLRLLLQYRDAFAAQQRLLKRTLRVVRHHQTHVLPAGLFDDFLLALFALSRDRLTP